MSTWLDETVDVIALAMGGPDDERDSLARMHAWTLAHIVLTSEINDEPFMGDLHAFVEPRFGRVTCCLRLTPALAQELMKRPPDNAERLLFGGHCEVKDFTLVDCPEGGVSIGADVEVRAVIVKVARVVRDYAAGGTANVTLEDHLSIDVVVGRRGRSTFQHVSFRGLLSEAHVASLVASDGMFEEEMTVAELLARAGTDPAGLLSLAAGLACRAIAYAARVRGSGLVRAFPRRSAGERSSGVRATNASFFEVDELLSLVDAPTHGIG